jgi:uncharacterized surface protein with fasciclin (FAS1) repeats
MGNMKRYLYSAACTGILALLCFTCQDDRWEEHGKVTEKGVGATLLDVIRENPEWSSFYQALTVTGYDSVLNEANSFTVFAPANSAWASVKMDDTAALTTIVSSQIAYEKKLSLDVALRNTQVISGKVLRYDDKQKSFSSARITSPDHVASNGVVHGMNKIFEVSDNIWEYILRNFRNKYSQVDYLYGWNRREMDVARSIRKGVNAQGQPVYDTAWVDVNDFLEAVPLNDEAQELTYVVLVEDVFMTLQDKYKPYFTQTDSMATEQLASFHVCRDLVFRGRMSFPIPDTITNIFGVKVRLKGANVLQSAELSNGRVYVVNRANVLLRDKIKPVIVEGENFTASADPQYVFTRYKPTWASGEKDVMLASSVTQQNRVRQEDGTFATVSKTFLWSDKYRANMNNFWVEYKADVYSVGYKIYYVAYDDIEGHYSDPAQRLRLEQKLFISFPGMKSLSKGSNDVNADAIENNYLGAEACFVGVDTAGVYKETQLRKWSLTLDSKSPQLLKEPLRQGADTMKVSRAGALTLWLCNTARATTASAQGMLFLDYIKLVPDLPEEKEE